MKNVWHERRLGPGQRQRICALVEDGLLAWRDPSVPSGGQSCPENLRQREAGFHHFIRWGDGAHFDKNPYRILWLKFLFNPAISLSDVKQAIHGRNVHGCIEGIGTFGVLREIRGL